MAKHVTKMAICFAARLSLHHNDDDDDDHGDGAGIVANERMKENKKQRWKEREKQRKRERK